MNNNGTKVRYAVHYNDKNYEYALHSGKRHFLRNLADVINVIEYCVTQDLKKNLYKKNDYMYNVNVIRMVNDINDENWDFKKFNESIVREIVDQIINDNIQRNA